MQTDMDLFGDGLGCGVFIEPNRFFEGIHEEQTGMAFGHVAFDLSAESRVQFPIDVFGEFIQKIPAVQSHFLAIAHSSTSSPKCWPSGPSPISPSALIRTFLEIDCKLFAEIQTRPVQPGFYGRHRYSQGLCGFEIGKALDIPKNENRSILRRQSI